MPWYYAFVEQMFKTKYALPYPELSPIYPLLGGRVFPLLSPSPDRCDGENTWSYLTRSLLRRYNGKRGACMPVYKGR